MRIRANRANGELEIEGSPDVVGEWWEKVWPQLSKHATDKIAGVVQPAPRHIATSPAAGETEVPEVFGEFFNDFRSDITDVDKMLVAGAFVQAKDPDRGFATKTANQLLMDQNIKLTNASECVRRLVLTKRAFVVTDGKFRISAQGIERLKSLKIQHGDA
jgi:hypothetical protein